VVIALSMGEVMFRTVIAILAGLPMLMPQGLCICQFALRDCSTQNKSLSPTPASHLAGSHDCRCGHGHGKPAVAAECCQSLVAVSQSTPGHDRHDHDRNCPTVLAATPNKIATNPSPLVLNVVSAIAFASSVVSHSQICRTCQSVDPDASPPIILMYCTLLL
jgi:hypothetical protein